MVASMGVCGSKQRVGGGGVVDVCGLKHRGVWGEVCVLVQENTMGL